jgi:hypothetical protein
MTHLMAKAELQNKKLALNGCPITNTDDFKVNSEPLGNTRHNILQQTAGCTPHRPSILGIVSGLNPKQIFFLEDFDVVNHIQTQLAKLALRRNELSSNTKRNAIRYSYRA